MVKQSMTEKASTASSRVSVSMARSSAAALTFMFLRKESLNSNTS